MHVKTCPTHGPLTVEQCYVNKAGTTCRQCKKDKEKARRGANPNAHNERKRELRSARIETVRSQERASKLRRRPEVLEWNRRYYRDNALRFKTLAKAYQLQTKKEVLTHYCGGPPRCKECGESELRFLALDHIHGGGAAHAREIGGSGGYMALWARKNGYPPIFQVLCHNCNIRKSSCPGQSRAALQNARVRHRALVTYSGETPRCAICGETDTRVLTFHHVNNDGAEDRRRLKMSTRAFYAHLLRVPRRPDLEVRCHNHNLGECCLGEG